MGDENRRDAKALLEFTQLPAHLHAHLRVEVGERLVEQQDARADRDGARQRDALLLPSGKLARLPITKVRQPNEFERLTNARIDFGRRQASLLQPESDVLRHAHVRPERVGLEHHAHIALPRRKG